MLDKHSFEPVERMRRQKIKNLSFLYQLGVSISLMSTGEAWFIVSHKFKNIKRHTCAINCGFYPVYLLLRLAS